MTAVETPAVPDTAAVASRAPIRLRLGAVAVVVLLAAVPLFLAPFATTAGVLGGPIYGARPGLDATVLILALVVVVIGGLGSVRGALAGALIIGQVDTLGRMLVPELASFVLFAALALVLVLRPQGLFTRRGRA